MSVVIEPSIMGTFLCFGEGRIDNQAMHRHRQHQADRWATGSRMACCAFMAVAALLCACSPVFDWREIRIADATVSAWFPCKPVTESRTVGHADVQRSAKLLACDAGGLSFSWLTIEGPGEPTEGPQADDFMLRAVIESAKRRWGDTTSVEAPSGVTLPAGVAQPHWASYRAPAANQRPAVLTQALFWSAKGRVHQVVLSGAELPSTTIEAFFGQIRVQ